jgi:hypothetical protein
VKQADDMNTPSESSKLVELRAKTDRQLLDLIGSRVDAGLSLARMAADESRIACSTKAQLLEAKARMGYEEARRLLPLVRGISRAELHLVERRLEQLGQSLDGTPVSERIRAAC